MMVFETTASKIKLSLNEHKRVLRKLKQFWFIADYQALDPNCDEPNIESAEQLTNFSLNFQQSINCRVLDSNNQQESPHDFSCGSNCD